MRTSRRELSAMQINGNRKRGGAVSRRRRTAILAGAVCTALVALVFAGTASAQIVNLRAYNGPYPGGSFDGTGSVGPGGAPFSSSYGAQMDINHANGDFIVGNNNYWYKFNSAGAPSAFSAISPTTMVGTTGQSNWSDVSVDNSGGSGGVGEGEQGRVYGMSEGEGTIKGWKANGEPVSGGFAPPGGLGYSGVCGFDVAPDGNVWAGSWTGGPITEFNPDGTPTGESFNSGKSVCGMEIDAAGNFYIVDYCCGGVWKFSPTGENLGLIDPDTSEAADVAVDNGDGHIYTIHGDHVNEYNATGGFVGAFGGPEGTYPGMSGAEGVAVDETTHIVYVTDNSRVDSFKRTGNITIPDVTTEGAQVTATTATIHATVDRDVPNSGAPINACVFRYGTNPANLSNETPCDGSAPFSGGVEATIGGLTTGTTYYYKITAANESNSVFASGGVKELQPAGPPEISEESVSAVNTDGAVISARIAPGGGLTEWWIEFGPTTAYGGKLPVPTKQNSKTTWRRKMSLRRLSGLTARRRITTTGSSPKTQAIQPRAATTRSRRLRVRRPDRTVVQTHRFVSRLAQPSCSIAVPTSSPRLGTPTGTTSARRWSRGRKLWANSPPPVITSSIRFSSAPFPEPETRPTSNSIRMSPPATRPQAGGKRSTSGSRPAGLPPRHRSAPRWLGRAESSVPSPSETAPSATPASPMGRRGSLSIDRTAAWSRA